MKLVPKNKIEIEKMRAAGRLTAQLLDEFEDQVKVGVTTQQLNDFAEEFCRKYGAIPAAKGYKGYPKAICTSVNEVVCHGVPNDNPLEDGDILNIDPALILDGYYGDASRMYLIGDVKPQAKQLVETTYQAMMAGIDTIKSGSRLNEIGKAIQKLADNKGYSVVREYCGHGLGKVFHEDPMVLHYASDDPRTAKRIKSGLTFTVEPMINIGGWETELMTDDNWTVKTRDRSLSAQYEHTILVTMDGVEILTQT